MLDFILIIVKIEGVRFALYASLVIVDVLYHIEQAVCQKGLKAFAVRCSLRNEFMSKNILT